MGARYYFDKKDTVEDCKSFNVKFLKDNGYFSGFRSGTINWSRGDTPTGDIGITVSTIEDNQWIELDYHFVGKENEKYKYKFRLTSTQCNFGGKRYWFICRLNKNEVYCGRRVGTLYRAPGANYFGCRHCMDLSYYSRNLNRRYRNFPLFHIMSNTDRIEKLELSMKRTKYAGKATKKFKRLTELRMQHMREAMLAYSIMKQDK